MARVLKRVAAQRDLTDHFVFLGETPAWMWRGVFRKRLKSKRISEKYRLREERFEDHPRLRLSRHSNKAAEGCRVLPASRQKDWAYLWIEIAIWVFTDWRALAIASLRVHAFIQKSKKELGVASFASAASVAA